MPTMFDVRMDDHTDRPSSVEVRESLLEAADRLREIRQRAEAERTDAWLAEMSEARNVLLSLDAEERVISRMETEERQAKEHEGRGPSAATGRYAEGEFRSAGEVFATSPEFRSFVENSGGNGTSPGIQVEVRTLITTSQSDTPSGGLFMPRGTPYLGNVDRRRLFVRQLLPGGNTGLNSIPYIREVNPRSLETGATTVAEGAAKPEVTMQFVEADAIVRKIAAWVPVTTEILADAPTLRSYIDARLGYMLMVAEENQILNGTGSGSDLRGIRQTVGLQTQAAITGDFPATIGMANALLENVDLEMDGVAMNPTDYWTMQTTRHANRFDGIATGTGPDSLPYAGPSGDVWGQPTVRTRAMPQGKTLAGAWRLAAQILDREGATMKTSDSHVDYFINNKVAILIEERLALPVYRPDGFVEVTLA